MPFESRMLSMNAPAIIREWLDERLDLDELTELSRPRRAATPPQPLVLPRRITLFLFSIQSSPACCCFCTTGPAPRKPTRACNSSPTACSSVGWCVPCTHGLPT